MKKLLLLSFLLFTSMALTGCAGEQVLDSERTKEKRGSRMLDFGQPEEKPDISGLVKSIVGNEVTVLKMERFNKEEGDEKETDREERPVFNPSAAMSGGGAARGMGRGMRGSGRQSEESRVAMFEKIKAMSAGEEKIIIPVGIQMLKFELTEEKKPNMVEATLEDVTADRMLQIWLDDTVEDRKVASFVVVK